MEVADLMVGDWINYKSQSSGKLSPIKIENIYGVEFNCEVEYWNIKSGYSISDTEPIELTEEILVKNGFKFKRHEFKTTNDDYWISDDKRIIFRGEHMTNSFNKWSVHIDTEDMRTMAYIEITYVHELQHLLRLCGVEKEITL